jgi:GNAT superfamily N-acetyltransferase
MKLADIPPGWHTDFIVDRFDAQIIERDDCLVVRTPHNPTYYWGNCLHTPELPRDDEIDHWLARFEAEITSRQPASSHVAIGSIAPYAGERRPGWQARGFELILQAMLVLPDRTALRLPSRAARGQVRLRPLDLPRDSEALIEVEMTDAAGFEPAGYRAYLRDQHARFARMQAAGLLQWFGLECDGALAATCGLLRDEPRPGAAGRYQRVVTHSAWRRRGLASALVHAVARHAFEPWGVAALYIAADPEDAAIGIYRSLGFAPLGCCAGLQRKSPQDQPQDRAA